MAADAVWSVISTPAMHERLDARLRLESSTGDNGSLLSEYVLAMSRGSRASVHLRYVIVDAEQNVRLVVRPGPA
jgi:hypothetical protein